MSDDEEYDPPDCEGCGAYSESAWRRNGFDYCYKCHINWVREQNRGNPPASLPKILESLKGICDEKGFAFSSDISEQTGISGRKVGQALRRLADQELVVRIPTPIGKPTIWTSKSPSGD